MCMQTCVASHAMSFGYSMTDSSDSRVGGGYYKME